MASAYVVVGEDNLTSWSDKTESGERFSTLKAARRRAAELANNEPGTVFTIFQSHSEAVAPVGAVELKGLA